MQRNDEEMWNVERPVVVASPGQRWAGWLLRGFAGLLFFGGTLVALIGLAAGVLDFVLGKELLRAPGLWSLVAVELAATMVMVLGSLMGSFGLVLSGTVRTVRGSQFVSWSLAAAGRDVLIVIGVGLLFSSLCSLVGGFVWLLFGVIAGSGVALIVGASLLNRVMRRIEAKGKR